MAGMNLPEKLNSLFRPPQLTRPRIFLALAIAMAADGLQLMGGWLAWLFVDQAIDCVAMVLISRVIGFHLLLLPTFVLELIPLIDDLPTWTACTAAVIVLRRRNPPAAMPPPSAPPDKPVIEV
jgi:hypothetical protein